MNQEELRGQFPQLSEKVYGKPLVYLDNAATSLRPASVVSKWSELSSRYTSNLHRAVHFMASKATAEYEAARAEVASFLGAMSPEEIVFTSGTTASVNLVAYSFGQAYVHEGDEIIVTEEEHHSNIIPWQLLCERNGATLKVLGVDDRGELKLEDLPALLSSGKVKIACVSQASNVLGILNPVKEIVSLCHEAGVPVFVDGAQGAAHGGIDVSDCDCDFYAFSGHKIYAATGTGVLYGKKNWLDRLPPFIGGGEMIESVKWGGSTYARAPFKFEAGTQNFSSVPTLLPALELASEIRTGEIAQNCDRVRQYVLNALLSRDDIILYGNPQDADRKLPLFSFCIRGVHHEDAALILDKMGIALRSGQMCAEPLMDRYGVSGMLRASFAPYNTMQEAEYFITSLERAIAMLR